ncbi:hypothetical protein C8R47DRAFT_525533 [Mycena vitilis]|nr:hypothetical protein C8R47DRAFT_525533 [Mycena vitilis]
MADPPVRLSCGFYAPIPDGHLCACNVPPRRLPLHLSHPFALRACTCRVVAPTHPVSDRLAACVGGLCSQGPSPSVSSAGGLLVWSITCTSAQRARIGSAPWYGSASPRRIDRHRVSLARRGAVMNKRTHARTVAETRLRATHATRLCAETRRPGSTVPPSSLRSSPRDQYMIDEWTPNLRSEASSSRGALNHACFSAYRAPPRCA